PIFGQKMKNVEGRIGEDVRFEIQVEGTPVPAVTFHRESEQIYDGGRYSIVEEENGLFVLTIRNTRPEDAGEYQCIAVNGAGEVTSKGYLHVEEELTIPQFIDMGTYKCQVRNDLGRTSTSAHLNIIVATRPEFKEKLTKVEVTEGDRAKFEVRVKGYPYPEVEWYHGSNRILDEDRFEIESVKETGYYSLTVGEVVQEDAGMYKCIAVNKAGKSTCRADLEVNERQFAPEFETEEPTILQRLQPVDTIEGEAIKMECRVSGKPEPTITWLKDGLVFLTDNRIKTYFDGDVCTLTIRDVKLGDEGIYRCNAKNSSGS
ncbi:predicted protein, partial [Nematostella vectensis]